MSRKEVPRAGLVKATLVGQLTNADAALGLHLSVRQIQRLKGRYRTEGPRGLLHRLRGRASPRRLPADVRQRVGELLRTTYQDVNDCHVTEKLCEVEGLVVSRASVRRIRRALGLSRSTAAGPASIGRAARRPPARGVSSSSTAAPVTGSKSAAHA